MGISQYVPISRAEIRAIVRQELNHLMNTVVLPQLHGFDGHIMAIENQLTTIGEIVTQSQGDVDALTTAVTDLTAKVTADDAALKAAVTGIQNEITALQQANPKLDLSGLSSAVSAAQGEVANLDQAAAAVQALVPAPPPAPSA